MTAGGVGAFIGTPAELALIRMTSDGRLPVNERRNYSSVFNALIRIQREEGTLALWRVSFFSLLQLFPLMLFINHTCTGMQANSCPRYGRERGPAFVVFSDQAVSHIFWIL